MKQLHEEVKEMKEVTIGIKSNIPKLQELLKQAEIQSEQLQETLKKIEEFDLEVEVQR